MRARWIGLAAAMGWSGCGGGEAPGGTEAPLEETTGTTGSPDAPTGPVLPASTGGSGETPEGTSSSSTTDEGDPPAPSCGDGQLDPGEACDLGRDNSNVGPCTLHCEEAVCGDGLHWVGVEECDWGEGNADGYGTCQTTCVLGSACGDGVLDVGFEECDLGEQNGQPAPEGNVRCLDGCVWEGRLVFLSSTTHDGALGGLSGADLKCQNLAEAAGYLQWSAFKAWLSDATEGPLSRFETVDVEDEPYVLPDGRILAQTFEELTTSGPRVSPAITETGLPVFDAQVWTHTDAFGEPTKAPPPCSDWLLGQDGFAQIGLSGPAAQDSPEWDAWQTERLWTASLPLKQCLFEHHLYCFEDG